ncbi:hypothetical protein D6774_03705 [Candidatus Woesearchaeota archaeon]|nr:MAG: hypothetical protein D6774_03705 [Candidatus Woesearchaeota archaeon]
MQRKIIPQGKGGATISLPIDWVRKHNLKAGDSVYLEEERDALFITSTFRKKEKSKEILFTHTPSLQKIRTIVASLYKAGYTQITLTFPEEAPHADLATLISTFTGLEIISQTPRQVVIHSFLTQDPQETEQLITKLFHTVHYLFSHLSTIDTEEGNAYKINTRKVRDHCLRLIHTTKHGGDVTYDYYDIVTTLEKITTELARVIQHKTCSLVSTLFPHFDNLYTAYLKKDSEKSMEVYDTLQRIREKDNKRMQRKTYAKKYPVEVGFYYILEERLLQLASRVISTTLQKT